MGIRGQRERGSMGDLADGRPFRRLSLTVVVLAGLSMVSVVLLTGTSTSQSPEEPAPVKLDAAGEVLLECPEGDLIANVAFDRAILPDGGSSSPEAAVAKTLSVTAPGVLSASPTPAPSPTTDPSVFETSGSSSSSEAELVYVGDGNQIADVRLVGYPDNWYVGSYRACGSWVGDAGGVG
jgi:hypothetical protein